MVADGLVDFKDALIQCNETILIKDLMKFVSALVACTESEYKFLHEVLP